MMGRAYYSARQAASARPSPGNARRAAEGCLLRRSSLLRDTRAACWLSSLVLSLVGARAVRSSAAGLRSLPGLRCVPAGLALGVSGARLARRRPADHARSSGLSGWRGGRRTWMPPGPPGTRLLPSWPGRDLVGRGTSPPRDDSQEWTSPPFRCSKSGSGANDTRRAQPGQYHDVINPYGLLSTGGHAGYLSTEFVSVSPRACLHVGHAKKSADSGNNLSTGGCGR